MKESLIDKGKELVNFLTSKEVFMSASVGSFLVSFIEKYLFGDWELLSWISILIALEAGVSFYLAIKNNRVSSKFFEGFLQKYILYGICLILSHILKHYTIDHKHPTHLDWLAHYLSIGIILKETLSVIEALSQIKNFIPKWILKKLKKMQSTEPKGATGPFTKENHK